MPSDNDDFHVIIDDDDCESEDDDKARRFSVDIIPPGRIAGNLGGMMALVLEVAVLLTLLRIVR